MNHLLVLVLGSALFASNLPTPDAVTSATPKGTPPPPQTQTQAQTPAPPKAPATQSTPTTTKTPSQTKSTASALVIPKKTFTIEQVAKYNGLKGAKSYVVIKGIVYDVTPSKTFKAGVYKGMKAGTDISKAFSKLSNQATLLKSFVPVGTLVKSSVPSTTAKNPSSSKTPTTPASVSAPSQEGALTLTLSQLEKYNGKNGQPAYVAVDGIIYDVSAIRQWKYGNHYEGIEAGHDLTEAILESPHGKAMLSQALIVGKLQDSGEHKSSEKDDDSKKEDGSKKDD